ncbi:hypothetical protein FJ930_29125 [Mesorhizobium sp. B2-4-15]|uniref:hypothetical protein n=1 Tax=Mesorhizobium sp. B2-4-15 TaxID=2589934 RepID=UPI001153E3A3|nr:hypothetical protein [Mesorhizobium sp. B2-4-15]TPK59702.1 hypothetical protein FJ930_29125 [Mesorhizobium sp. B2-4-15]
MRRIEYDPAKIAYPPDWKDRAASLLQQLTDAADIATRQKILGDANNRIWAELKLELRKLSQGKCWYTEALQAGTDVDVDHYRPKGRVAELIAAEPPHPGYWWLAYDPSNYRFSCIVANRRRQDVEAGRTGGKADHFPIQHEVDRAYVENVDYSAEKPLLIDPCVAHEPDLITFKEDGEAMPRFSADQDYKHRKAAKSIELYSINHSDFVKARLELRDRIEKLKKDAKRFFAKLETGDADHESGYASTIAELARLRSASAPFSAFCAATIEPSSHEDYLFPLRHA